MAPDKGSFEYVKGIKIGYYDQENRGLDDTKTVFEEMHDEYPEKTNLELRSALALFLFCGEDVDKPIRSLSGGEKALVAISIYFAIMMVNPPPFCLLDEVESALDEVNVARFAEYIKRYSSETQFILITHRRGTMEAANRLYGVTMPERGISKVLELDIAKISKKEGEDWDGIFG